MVATAPNRDQALNLNACRKLVAEVICKAVEDYKVLVARGIVRHGFVRPGRGRRNRRSVALGYFSDAQLGELLHFFQRGSGLDYWIHLAGLSLDPDRIRAELARWGRADDIHGLISHPKGGFMRGTKRKAQ